MRFTTTNTTSNSENPANNSPLLSQQSASNSCPDTDAVSRLHVDGTADTGIDDATILTMNRVMHDNEIDVDNTEEIYRELDTINNNNLESTENDKNNTKPVDLDVDSIKTTTTTYAFEDEMVHDETQRLQTEKDARVSLSSISTRPKHKSNDSSIYTDDEYNHAHLEKTSNSARSVAIPSGGLSEQRNADASDNDKRNDHVEATSETTTTAATAATAETATVSVKPLSKSARRRKRILRELGDVEIKTDRRKIKLVSLSSDQFDEDSTAASDLSRSAPKTLKAPQARKRIASSKSKNNRTYDRDDTSDQDNDEDEPEYEVEAIRDHQTYRSHVLRYQVKWKGYPESENTSEPASTFHADCMDLVVKYWLSRPAHITRPHNIPPEAKRMPYKQQPHLSTTQPRPPNHTPVPAIANYHISPTYQPKASHLASASSSSSQRKSESSTMKTKHLQEMIDRVGNDDVDYGDEFMDIDSTFDLDNLLPDFDNQNDDEDKYQHDSRASNKNQNISTSHLIRNGLTYNADENDDENDDDDDDDYDSDMTDGMSDNDDDGDDDYSEDSRRKSSTPVTAHTDNTNVHGEDILFDNFYDPESPATPLSSSHNKNSNLKSSSSSSINNNNENNNENNNDNGNVRRNNSNDSNYTTTGNISKGTEKQHTAASMAEIEPASSLADISSYIKFVKENNITQRSIATSYKTQGFELAYSRPMVPLAKKLSWDDDAFMIQNILPLKNNRSQLMAYLIWSNGLKTAHLIQELHDKCSKKLCRYYEARIRYT